MVTTGDWQKFKGLPGTEGTLRFAEPKPDKRIAYEAAVKDAMNEPAEGATTLKKKAVEKLAAAAQAKDKANEPPVAVESATAEENSPETSSEATPASAE